MRKSVLDDLTSEERKARKAAQRKAWVAANPERMKALRDKHRAIYKACGHSENYRLNRKYGITLKQRDAMIAKIKGVCPGCLTTTPRGQGWHVDHDHTTGKVRGILCHDCNIALGHLKDDVATMQRLIKYLRKHSK